MLDSYKFEANERGFSEIFSDLREKDIETVLPSSKDLQNQRNVIMLLNGPNRGKTGHVLSIDKKKDAVIVQVDICDLVTVSQDDCCLVV